MEITIPYPTTSNLRAARSSTMFCGWASLPVDVPEVDPSVFKLCLHRFLSGRSVARYYVHDSKFWAPVGSDVHWLQMHKAGIDEEQRLSEQKKLWKLLAVIGSHVVGEQFERRHPGRLVTLFALTKRAPKTHLAIDDYHPDDKALVSAWCDENLLWADGKLMMRVNAPFLIRTFDNEHLALTQKFQASTQFTAPTVYGFEKHVPGIYFEHTDPGFNTFFDDLPDFGWPEVYDFDRHEIQFPAVTRSTREPMERVESVFYDPQLIETASENREDAAELSLLSLAVHTRKTTNPSRMRPGLKRDALHEIARLVDTPKADRGRDFMEYLGTAMGELPTDEEPARKFFIDWALDRWKHTNISVPSVGPLLR